MLSRRTVTRGVAIVAVAAAVIVSGCAASPGVGGPAQPVEDPPAATSAGASAGGLEVIPWTLEALASADGSLEPLPDGVAITATFDAGKMKGFGGVNSYETSFTVQGRTLGVGPNVSTSKKVGPASVMAAEAAYLATILKTASYRSDGEGLELLDASGSPILAYHLTGK
jgi:heat shock protein HslJ